jgi:ubiquinone/menaquinone biosynthesis C-methylase UbiE
MIDKYEKFAYDYDEFGSIANYLSEEKLFFEKLFAKYEAHSVLDCACGTGHHLNMFSDMGLDVSGSDYSESMINVANKNLNQLGKEIPIMQCDFRYLEKKYNNTFDAVVCLATALPHLHTDEDLLTALKSMYHRLNKNGLLILTQGATHYTLSLPSIEVVVNRTDFSRVFVKEHDDQFQTIHVLDLFHSEARTEYNQYDMMYRILLDEDYKRLLTEAGFNDVQIYGDYEMNAYDKQSKRLIVVAVKT